jgi:anti-sigma regulatory factor (Ser/Thr protein kinase)
MPVAEEKGVTLRMEAGAPVFAHGDGELLFEAVANVLDNAVKFTPPGGRVDLALLTQPGGAIVRVADTGPGIPVAERTAVLRRFHRGDRSRHAPGTGLGLSLVSAVARLHGFTFSLSERDGGGCCAVLECRNSADAGPARAPLPAGPVPDGGRALRPWHRNVFATDRQFRSRIRNSASRIRRHVFGTSGRESHGESGAGGPA